MNDRYTWEWRIDICTNDDKCQKCNKVNSRPEMEPGKMDLASSSTYNYRLSSQEDSKSGLEGRSVAEDTQKVLHIVSKGF